MSVLYRQDRGMAPHPTSYLPGTDGKVRVLIERAMCGYRLWHPLDASGEDKDIGLSARCLSSNRNVEGIPVLRFIRRDRRERAKQYNGDTPYGNGD